MTEATEAIEVEFSRSLSIGDALVVIFLTLAAAAWVVAGLLVVGQAGDDFDPSTVGQVGLLLLLFGPPWWAMQLVTHIVMGDNARAGLAVTGSAADRRGSTERH